MHAKIKRKINGREYVPEINELKRIRKERMRQKEEDGKSQRHQTNKNTVKINK